MASITSCGVALSAQTETGDPLRSAMAMIFVPLPRFVLPTFTTSYVAKNPMAKASSIAAMNKHSNEPKASPKTGRSTRLPTPSHLNEFSDLVR
jgi:hypothetical protein